ncbi:MAG: GNAT family N-acetyltransferase [Flavobacteriaceae bacterium]|nr:GNAT family N-acetyltransferase [Bacteroidia bacterium]MBT8288557.1 GNAT family N-acetyltransferase [Bacteroidia bacterium]NNF74811.1 GNAT family N-acetyltransferase [Flavobacteriaceae bacterium]NNK72803.1 GNAT family N-acetyltransferase [Flavobacteriaceae bacterium]
MKHSIKRADLSHLSDLIPLFDAYRVFYRQSSAPKKAKNFLKERIEKDESIIYLAYINDEAVGFVQLFPIFSSVSMEPMLLLNDLYIEEHHRGEGIGKSLIDKAKQICFEKQLKGLALQTEADNPAQSIYEHLGFIKDPDLFYFWTNTNR